MERPSTGTDATLAYIPADWRHALATGGGLAEWSRGSALFADISGFTPLTESLARAFGPRRGSEELGRHLDQVYDALIAQVDRHGGSVVSFAGDAVTCWFADDTPPGAGASPPARAVACAVAMQTAMRAFASIDGYGQEPVPLAVKVSIASGAARRFVVGDPAVQRIPVLAGDVLTRMAAGEHLAGRGEIVLDEATHTALATQAAVAEWRGVTETGERFAVLAGLEGDVAAAPWPETFATSFPLSALRAWSLPAVYNRLSAGAGEFLTELRPAVALFIYFTGIDYDRDRQAPAKLDAYVRRLQAVAGRYDGTLLQMTHGDKGSYAYMAFGAPVAHEDDARRAISAALELRALPDDLAFIPAVRIGISRGTMRTGSYGGSTRRTYGVLGDDVNLAARLMQLAQPGEILVSASAQQPAARDFDWESLPAVKVKGKAEPVTVYRAVGVRLGTSTRLREPRYTLPMVGREAELGLVREKMGLARAGRGQAVGITAEAGMGKSRLVAEVLNVATVEGLRCHAGECQSFGANTPYLAWHTVWQSLLGLDPATSAPEQQAALESRVARLRPDLAARVPLLGVLLNLPIPDNDLTRSFDAKLRKASLEAMLVDLLRAIAGSAEGPAAHAHQQPQSRVIVLEDCHWLDPLSADLLEVVGRALADLPVFLVLAYRPASEIGTRTAGERLSALSHFAEVRLSEFTAEEADRLAAAKLRQIFGVEVEPPPILRERIHARAQGNPFYIEELLNYLKDRDVKPTDPAAIERLDLPTSLHSLVLSRIDRLGERQQLTLKVASIIGRLFRFHWLWGVYPRLGLPEEVKRDLDALSQLDLTPLDQVEPELIYLFKHAVTQEVAYESQPRAARAVLHDHLGKFVERVYAETLGQFVDLLAFHFDRGDNLPKRREYLRKAGEAAQAAYGNTSAIDYYRRVLPLLPEAEQGEVRLRLGEVCELTGAWPEAEEQYRLALGLAEANDDLPAKARAQRAIGWLLRKRGDYAEALPWLEGARETYARLDDPAGASHALADVGEVYRLRGEYAEARARYAESLRLAEAVADERKRLVAEAYTLRGAGTVATWQGDYAAARALNERSLAIRRDLSDKPGIAVLLNNQAIVARCEGDLAASRRLCDDSIAAFREIGDLWSVGQLLNNHGCVANDLGERQQARALLRESLAIRRQLGDRAGLALSLTTLADVLLDQGEHGEALPLLAEGLPLTLALGDRTMAAYMLEDLAGLAAAGGRPERALRLGGCAAALREAIGAPLSPPEQARVDRLLAPARAALSEPEVEEAWAAGRATPLEQAVADALGVVDR